MNRRITTILLLLFLLLALSACQPAAAPQNAGGSIYGDFKRSSQGEDTLFRVDVPEGGAVGVDFRGTLVQGSVTVQLRDAQGRAVWQETCRAGDFAVNQVVTPGAGVYQLSLAWQGDVQMKTYSLIWKPGPVEISAPGPVVLVGGVGMLLVSAGYAAYVFRRRLSAKYFSLGLAAWIVAVALKFLWAVPVNPPVYRFLAAQLPPALAGPLSWGYVGALTGVFEVLVVWAVLRRMPIGRAPFQSALAFGIGFGVVEALLLGMASLGTSLSMMSMPRSVPLAALDQFARSSTLLANLAPVSERLFTVMVHIFSNVAIFYAIARRRSGWMWLAFLYKTLIDSLAAYVQLQGLTGNLSVIWQVEGVVAVWGLLGLWATAWLGRHYPQQQPVADEMLTAEETGA